MKTPAFTLRFDADDKKGGYRGSHYSMIGEWTSMPYADERSAIASAKAELKRRDAKAVRVARGY